MAVMFPGNSLKDVSWEAFHALRPAEKKDLLASGDRPYHVLYAQQFDRPLLDRVCSLATMIRRIAKTRGGLMFLQGLLAEKRAMLYFVQPSTRTFLSFFSACEIVGLKPGEVRGTSTSSEVKGESPEDTVRTFSSYFDMIIMRHPEAGFAERIAWLLSTTERPVPVVNAGSGKDQHPTQALLDVYTLQRSFEKRGGIEGKTILFVGDLARGRTVRSLSRLLALYPGVRLIFAAPASLRIGDDILEDLQEAGVPCEVTESFHPVMGEADAIYMTRIQDEWDAEGESRPIDLEQYSLTSQHLARLKPDAAILHPLPRRQEIALEVDHDPRAMYWRQVRNGMWVRAALMLFLFHRDGEIDRYHADLVS